jgi:hypothetical protein
MPTNEQLKSYFETGDKPTQEQFAEFIDAKLSNDYTSSVIVMSASLSSRTSYLENNILSIGTSSTDVASGDHTHVNSVVTVSSSNSITIDFSKPYLDLYLTHNVAFTSSNLTPATQINFRIITSGSGHTFAWPLNWVWLNNSMPVSQSANTSAMLSSVSWGTTDGNVQSVYAYN